MHMHLPVFCTVTLAQAGRRGPAHTLLLTQEDLASQTCSVLVHVEGKSEGPAQGGSSINHCHFFSTSTLVSVTY